MNNLLELTTAEPVSTETNPHQQIDDLILMSELDKIAREDMMYGAMTQFNPEDWTHGTGGLGLLEWADTGPLLTMKALAGLVGKGGKTAKKILDFTQGQAWKKPFKSGTTYKAYHGKPGGKPITDVYPGMHVGSPGAAIDRLSYKAGLPWRAKSKRVPAGYVTALEISPKKPLLKTSPHYEHIFRNITRRHFDDWRAKPLSMPRSLYRTDWKDLTPLNKSLIDEYIPEEYDFLDYFKGPYSRNLQFVRSLGYDTIPYINKWENPGSVSTIILNPKRASPKILDETYRFDMPFYKSTEPTLNLSKKQLKEWISQQKAGKGDLYDILIKNAPGQKLVIFNKYGIPEVASPFGPVKANKDYINQILTIKDLMQATK